MNPASASNRLASLAPVEKVERRHPAARRRRGLFPDHDEAIGLVERERAEKCCIDQCKERAVGADAERERDRGDDGEARRALS